MDSIINIGLYITYALVAVALVSMVLFPIFNMVTNFQRAKGGLLSALVLFAVIAAAIALSPAEQGLLYEKYSISPFQSKLIGGGLLATYLLFAGIFLAAIYTEVSKWFK
ncbi:MAG: hypothetical protein HPY80_10085 [Bacteroidales bacterium]|jgi:hypothetical protein|nr:hypothetical protein [Bacteroidales bacterium]